MNEEQKQEKSCCEGHWKGKKMGCGGGAQCGAYGLAVIGAAIYFIQHADTFWMGVFGVVKAIFWPAILIYKVMEFLKL